MSFDMRLYRNANDGNSLRGDFPLGDALSATSGFLRFYATRFIATETGNVTILVERYGGNSGSLSGAITQSDANRSNGKYTASSIPVSFADGEAGFKSYTFNITTAPTDGPYWINLALTVGAQQPRHWWDFNSEIEVNDGVSVPSVDTANVYEVGPSGDYTTINDAARAVQSPALVLIRGGTYANEDTQSDGLGINPRYAGDRSNRIIYMAYPSETPVIEADSSITDMTAQVPNNAGFLLRPSRAGNAPLNGLVFKGLTIKSASLGVRTDSSSTYHQNIIVEDCTIYDVGGSAGTNPAGIRFDDARNCVARNNNIHHIYEGMDLHLNAHDNNACIHGYRGCEVMIEDNTLNNASHAVYHKNPPLRDDGQTGYTIRRNRVDECYSAFRLEDHYVGKGTDYHFNNVDICYNIVPLSSLIDCQTQRTFYSSSGLWIYNNNCGDDLGSLGGFKDVEVYNNIQITASDTMAWSKEDDWVAVESNPYDPSDSNSWPVSGDPDSTNVHEIGTISYYDHNVYWPSINIKLAKNGSDAQTLTTLAQWQAATDADIMPTALAGANSALTDPALDAGHRATNSLPVGRFGLAIGVPSSVAVGGTLTAGEEFSPYDSTRAPVVGAYHIDPINGSDTNDGILVSEGGTGPWRTPNVNLTNLVAGDTLYLREGTHTVTSHNMKYSHASGSAENPIEITSYPGEEPVIDCSAGTWLRLQNCNYWSFTHLKLTNYLTGWDVGEDIAAQNCKWYSIYAETDVHGDNVGLIRMRDATAYDVDKVIMKFTGDPLTAHQNTGGIYHNDSNNSMSGTYNRVEAYNFPSGIYFKHGDNTLTEHTGNIVVSNSFFYGCTRNAIGYNASGVKFSNTIFHTNVNLAESDGGQSGIWNWFENCTFYGYVNLRDQGTGAHNNKFTDCLVTSLNIDAGSVTSDSDYNLFVNDVDDLGTLRNLASWQAANSSDANSLQGAPSYAGSNFELVSSYALGQGSIGKNAGSSGSDIGADVSKVGALAA